ncbi:VirE2 family protein [Rhizobium puerariae]|uniref:VirE2 family protein n=1 Tax=Rhizobium puerariae TaxID=1585791 RepID=A0ABV6AMN1_9HYPH
MHGVQSSSDAGTAKKVKLESTSHDIKSLPDLPDLEHLPGSTRSSDAYIVANRKDGQWTGKTNGNLDRQLTTKEFEEACCLHRDGAGNYYPSPVAFERIPIPDEKKAEWGDLPKKEFGQRSFAYRLDIWRRENQKRGITTDKIFFEKDDKFKTKDGRLKPEDQILKTEYGDRRVEKRYKYPLQAGTLLPDIMIKTGKGEVHFLTRHANDNMVGKGFDDFQAAVHKTYGENAEIKLKSSSGIMHDANYLNMWEKGGADRRFRSFVGERAPHDLDLPKATVNIGRRPDGNGGYTRDRHVSIEALKYLANPDPASAVDPKLKENAAKWVNALEKGELWDRVQLQTRNGKGYQTPGRMSYADSTHFKNIMKEVGLPESMGEQRQSKTLKFEGFERNSAALVQVGPQLKDARDLSPEERGTLSSTQVLIADRNDDGQSKGTYTSMAEYQRLGKRLPDKAAADLGMPADQYSKNFVKPEKVLPPVYDTRARSTEMVR